MFGFLKKIPLLRGLVNQRKTQPDENDNDIVEEKWTAAFNRPGHIRFAIKSESSHDANIRQNALCLGLKKSHCLAWVEAPSYRYQDLHIEARFRLDPHGGYGAAGFLFRVMDEGTHYSVLVSSKGYFRLDAVRNGTPLPLIGWTEAPLYREEGTTLDLVAYTNRLLLRINGSWAAEINDDSISAGELYFAAVSYEAGTEGAAYTAEAFLDFLSVDTRIAEVAALYEKWSGSPADPQSRFRLAETFAAMGQGAAALVQLKQGWEQPGRERTAGELLFAGRLALELGRIGEAEEYIIPCIAAGGPEGEAALVEKARILYAAKRFNELEAHTAGALELLPREPLLHRLHAQGLESLGEYKKAAAAYDRVYGLDEKDGFSAAQAAAMYEAVNKPGEALERYLRAGRIFLGEENYPDLEALMPRLLSLGHDNWEVRGLAGKWAFGIEDWNRADDEFKLAEKLRKKTRPRPPQDAAQVFLQGLLLIRGGKRREALSLLEKAAALAPDYPLFRFRLAENRFLLSGKADPKLGADLKAALKLAPEDGWVRNFAAQVALSRGDLAAAAEHLEKASASLGEIPAIRVNQAVLYSLRGDLEGALSLLGAEHIEDAEGLMANCAGNLLVRAGRYEEAEDCYRRALSLAPDNREYLCNRASCLIEMGRYGAADELLTKAHREGPDTTVLELISYIASRKGEYARAESASRAALEIDSGHGPSLLALGQLYLNQSRWDEGEAIIQRLEALSLEGDAAARRDALRKRFDDARTRLISCASCGRTWKVPISPPPAPPIRLFAMPPDDLPAGTCTKCGATYCIGCGKKKLNKEGRFMCPKCGKSLKLINEGLKQMVYDWAAAALPKSARLKKPKT